MISVTDRSRWRWTLGTGTWEALGVGGGAWPDLARPSPVEPLSGNLVEKDCAESCTPTHNLQGQVSRGSSATLCCRGDLCNDSLQSAAPARALLTSAPLGLALALGLLALTWAASL